MQKRNNKKWVRRIVMGIIIWMVMSMGLNAAFAINLQLKVDGACPGETVEVQGTGGSCGDPTSDEIKKCEGDIYIPTAETCPKEAGTDTGTSQTAQEAIAKLVAVIKAVEETLNKMLWPILFLIGGLLENDILFGGGMEQRLYDIWVPIRNIVNIIFVLTLVGLALYSVLGINSENSQYSIKTMLPKLIAGIIAVNFSFIGMKVFLDTVSVFTSAIFAIPAQIEETSAPVLGNDSDLKTQAFCREVYGISTKKGKSIKDFGAVLKDQALLELAKQYGIPTHFKIETIEDVGKSLPGGNGERFTAELDRLRNLGLCTVSSESSSSFELSEHGLQYFEKYRSSNAALAMAINMGEVMFYDGSGSALGSGSYESLAINAIFSLLLYIVYGISFGVLFIVLLARLIVLWLGIALSPIIALSIAVPVAKEKFKMGELTQKFVAHAIAPITIALSMTIGWIMLTAIKSTMSDGGFAMSGSILIPSLPIPGLETLQGLLVSIATVAVVWVGVFMAANETIAGTITEGIKSQVQRFGGWLATAPFKYTSWVPVETKDGTTTNLTPAGIMAAGQSLRSKIETAGTEKALKAFGIEKVNAGFDNIKPAMAADDLSETVQNTKLESDKKLTKEKLAALAGTSTINELDKMIEAGGKGGEFAELMKNAIEKSKKGDELSGTEIKALQNAASAYNKERADNKGKEPTDKAGETDAAKASTEKAAEVSIIQDPDLLGLIPAATATALKTKNKANRTIDETKALGQLKNIDDELDNASTATAIDHTEYDNALGRLVEALKKTDKFKNDPAGAEAFAVAQMQKRAAQAQNTDEANIQARAGKISTAFVKWKAEKKKDDEAENGEDLSGPPATP